MGWARGGRREGASLLGLGREGSAAGKVISTQMCGEGSQREFGPDPAKTQAPTCFLQVTLMHKI